MSDRATEDAVRRIGADVFRQIDEARKVMTATAADVERLATTDPLICTILMAYRHGRFDSFEDCLLAMVVALHGHKEAALARLLELHQMMPLGPVLVPTRKVES